MKIFIIKLLSSFIFISLSLAETNRPFWTEKSMYSEGSRTYFVGVATAKKNVEQARNEALKNARNELMNHLQVSDVKDITFHTQMTFEEKMPTGEITIFRLMYVEASDIEMLRENKSKDLLKAQEIALKANELRIKNTEEAINKAKANESKLKSKQIELDEIISKIDVLTSDANEKLKCGMTKAEVVKIMGKPRSTETCSNISGFNYGRKWAIFESGVLSCLAPADHFRKCGGCSLYIFIEELCK